MIKLKVHMVLQRESHVHDRRKEIPEPLSSSEITHILNKRWVCAIRDYRIRTGVNLKRAKAVVDGASGRRIW